VEGLVKLNFAIDLLDDVVFNQYQTIHFNVDRKPIRVETSGDLLVDLYENIVCGLFDRSLTVLLRH
jgi:hypothetical protein